MGDAGYDNIKENEQGQITTALSSTVEIVCSLHA